MRKLIEEFSNASLYDFSCSERIIHAANKKYNLNLSENEFRMMAPFSGGMYEQESCGIMTAGLAVLGIMFTNNVSHTSPLLREAVLEFKTMFKQRFGSTTCKDLVETQRDDIVGCSYLIESGGELLQEVIDKYVKLLK